MSVLDKGTVTITCNGYPLDKYVIGSSASA
jgi:hypothetical protein